MYKNSQAFTLGEVLITIGIIGIVAIIVIPIVNVAVQNELHKNLYKKAFSVASQAVNTLYLNSEYHDSTEGVYNFNLLKSQLNVAKDCSGGNNNECWAPGELACTGACGGSGLPVQSTPAFIDNSGMSWSNYSTNESYVLLDTNGFSMPNRYGKDRWFLWVQPALTSGKLAPRPDYTGATGTGTSDTDCHYPPCYPTSWLY